ncbi:MAG: serine hydrolase [Bacteroidetes bacterium]|nr:serine hydrolase [Bacteroidota bacterium]
MKKTILFLTLLVSTAFAQQPTPDARFAGLDTLFTRVLNEWKCAGFAVAVVEKDKIIYAKGFGYADIDTKRPVTEHTQFAAGSCTKPFTCAALGLLRAENKIDFNHSVREYLPQLSFYNEEMNKNITVRDLMCHRTGLPRHDQAWALFSTNSVDTLLKRVQYLEPNYGLREKWQYNNFMFATQGKMVENLSGQSYRAFVRERIFQPLGMKDVTFSVDSMTLYNDRSLCYTVSEDDKIVPLDYFNLDVMSAVGGINTSVSEMAKWVMLWANNGIYKGKRLLPADYVREAISSQMIVRDAAPSASNPSLHFENYGLGWFLSSYRGHYRVEHGGNISGFSTNTCFFPTDGIGIVVFCNQAVSRVPSVVRNILADRMLGLPDKDWQSYLYTSDMAAKNAAKSAKSQMTSLTKTNVKPAHPADEYEGYFQHKGYGTFEIVNRNDSLFAVFPLQQWYLRPYGHDVFDALPVDKHGKVASDASIQRIIFNQNTEAEIASASIAFEPELIHPLEFTWLPKVKKLPKVVLQRYVGEYNLNGMAMKVGLNANEILYLSLPNQPTRELEALGKGKFRLKGLNGYSISFSQDAKEFLLTQPNGIFKALKKKA